MRLFDLFVRRAPNKVFISMVLGALAGMSYALLIPLVLVSLEKQNVELSEVGSNVTTILSFEVDNFPFALMFISLCIFILLTRSLSQIILTRVGVDVNSMLRKNMYRRISDASTQSLEKVGKSDLMASLTTDVPRIVNGATALPDILINAVTIFGMLGFLLYLNIDVFVFVIIAIFVGSLSFQVPIFFSSAVFDRSREYLDKLFEAVQGLLQGHKELKLSRSKTQSFYNDVLLDYEKSVVKLDKRGHSILWSAISYGDLISFFVIGAVSFVFVNYHAISYQELIGVIMALLYITGPIAVILNTAPNLAVAKVSLSRVNELLEQLPPEFADEGDKPLADWSEIRFEQVCFQYQQDEGAFKVGPLDFSVKKGKVTFIIGGNGSGKSTLSKLITQHYKPVSGQVYFGDQAINHGNLQSARESIFAIYSDYYLFDRLFCSQANDDIKTEVDRHLVALSLSEKVTFEQGRFSTLDLSDGQKRRLALLVAYIEDKEVYLFDEWAADQDPSFKDIFYRDILVELKSRGKAVVVISHDDRYFNLADEIIVMDEGQIVKDIENSKHQLIDRYVTNRKLSTQQEQDIIS